MIKRALFFLLPAVLLAAPAPRFDQWRIIGPGGAGGMFLPTVSPHDPKTVFELCDMTGAYLSFDAGESWRMFNLRGTLSAFAFDPKDPKVMYAGNHALWQSLDGGKTWSMALPDPKRDTVEHMRDDHAGPLLTTSDPAYLPTTRVRFVAIDPADPVHVAVLFTGREGTRLVSSPDRGRHWTSTRDFSGGLNVQAMYFDGGLKLVADSRVFTIRGENRDVTPGPAGAPIRSASGTRGMLYATSDSGIHVSTDGGKTWRSVEKPLPAHARFLAIACSQYHPETAYVAFVGMRIGEDNFYGIAKTTDAGRTWAPVFQESRLKIAANLERSWVEEFYSGAGPIRDMGVSPTDPNICYVTDSCPRSFRTLDGGKSWKQIIAKRIDARRWTTTGFDVTTCYGIHFDPFNPKNRFISYTDVGLFKSADGGETWKSSIQGIRSHWDNTTYWVEFDPKVKGLMWGAFARNHDLPRPKMWRRQDPATYQGGVATSIDGGETWTVTVEGMPETAVTHILLDPASPVGRRTLYACSFGRGVYKSTDNGKSWTLKNTGIDKKQPFAWRITRAADGTLYLVVSRRSEGGYTGDAEDGAIYRSGDGAETWVKMKLPEGVNGPNGLTLDPRDNRRMYLSAWGVQLPDRVQGGGVYLSTDAGATWRNIFNASQHVYDVTVDPRNPDVIYNAGFETGAYRSLDRGATWTRLRGFNFKWGHRVIPDRQDPARIYVTTFGGSVWHGPAAGDPKAVEDIVTPVPVAP
jgi:photosystem II stability/assembly factor-like uncharacterized protein